jgi:hypothetical protein
MAKMGKICYGKQTGLEEMKRAGVGGLGSGWVAEGNKSWIVTLSDAKSGGFLILNWSEYAPEYLKAFCCVQIRRV